jgi:hypothetical protein
LLPAEWKHILRGYWLKNTLIALATIAWSTTTRVVFLHPGRKIFTREATDRVKYPHQSMAEAMSGFVDALQDEIGFGPLPPTVTSTDRGVTQQSGAVYLGHYAATVGRTYLRYR